MPAAVQPMTTYNTIAINENGTLVYYDQWENGYDADCANPTNLFSASNLGGTQVLGNGLEADGCAPNIRGVVVTCTDANDILHAGDVVLMNNPVALPRTPVAQNIALDNFNTVAYNNNNENTNWTDSWVEIGDEASPNYRDEFASVAYNLSVGSITWSTSWTEENDNNSPSNGLVRVDAGSLSLRFGRGSVAAPIGTAIYRAANLSAYTSATLSYSYTDNANQAGDAVQVQVRNPPGIWATLATINGTSGTGTGSHDVTAYMDTDTEIRFYVFAALEAGDLYLL